MSFSRDLQQKKILILGAGVTGCASARALTAREAEVTLVDESEIANSEFQIVKPSDVNVSDFDFVLISPGWKESHPLIAQAQAAHVA
jgi:UDP-N-acetylmuramoylalanine--D-glutamate ligase